MSEKIDTKARPTIGLSAGMFDEEGKLLLKRRTEKESLPRDWDLPGGAVEAENNAKTDDEWIVAKELSREIEEETGLKIPIDTIGRMPIMHPVVIKGGDDWAFVIAVAGNYGDPSKGEFKYVSPEELKELANGPQGNRLVSGWRKRMSRLALLAFTHSPNEEYRKQAWLYLEDILSRP